MNSDGWIHVPEHEAKTILARLQALSVAAKTFGSAIAERNIEIVWKTGGEEEGSDEAAPRPSMRLESQNRLESSSSLEIDLDRAVGLLRSLPDSERASRRSLQGRFPPPVGTHPLFRTRYRSSPGDRCAFRRRRSSAGNPRGRRSSASFLGADRERGVGRGAQNVDRRASRSRARVLPCRASRGFPRGRRPHPARLILRTRRTRRCPC